MGKAILNTEESRKLYDHLKGRLKLMDQKLKTLYLESDIAAAEIIHALRNNLDYFDNILIDLLFDEWDPKAVLDHFEGTEGSPREKRRIQCGTRS